MILKEMREELEVALQLATNLKGNELFRHQLDGQLNAVITKIKKVNDALLSDPLFSDYDSRSIPEGGQSPESEVEKRQLASIGIVEGQNNPEIPETPEVNEVDAETKKLLDQYKDK